MITWLAGCSGGGTFFTGAHSGFATASFLEVSATGAGAAPRLIVDLAFDGTLLVTWFDDDGVRSVSTDVLGDHHEVQLLGLLPDREYEFEVTAFADRQGAAQGHVAWTTPPLPADFPEVSTVIEGAIDGTDTLVAMRTGADDQPSGTDYLAVIRGDGRVVWWTDLAEPIQDVSASPEGFVALVGTTEPRIERWTWGLARTEAWSVGGSGTRLDTTWPGPLHSSLQPLQGGEYATLQRVGVEGTALPLDYDGTLGLGARTYGDEYAVVYDGASGRVVAETALSTFWPEARLGWGSLDDAPEGVDRWADARRLVVDDDGSLLWTLANQDAIVSYAPATGRVEWVLGQPYGLPPQLQSRTLLGATDLPWHPGSARWGEVDADGSRNLLVYDSGRFGTAPPTPPLAETTSRVLGYAVNERTRTATLAFELADAGTGPLSSAIGSATPQPDGSVLAVFGAVGVPAEAHVVAYDPAASTVLRHQIVRAGGPGVEIRAAVGLPPIDSFVTIETSDVRTTSAFTGDSGN